MLNYSFSTVLMAVISSNLMLVLITVFFINKKIMVNMGYKLLALFIGLTVLRFLFPFEVPFTTTISLERFRFLSMVISQIRRPLYHLGEFDFSVWNIFQVIWILGILYHLVKYIREHRKAKYFILANSLDSTHEEPYTTLLDRICAERKQRNCFKVLTVSGINKPMLYGIFSPCVLIPESIELSQEDLYYSLVHETAHHFHHDLLIKKLIRFIAILYWWNPICYILIGKVDVILEMRVDNVITSAGPDVVRHYLHSLFEIGERAADAEACKLSQSVSLSLLSDTDGELTQRYYMMMADTQKKSVLINIGVLALVILVYTTSYLYIFEAKYVHAEAEATSIGQSADIMYAVQKEDGTYDIYYKGIYTENTASLEYFSSDIPIYTEKEIKNEKH